MVRNEETKSRERYGNFLTITTSSYFSRLLQRHPKLRNLPNGCFFGMLYVYATDLAFISYCPFTFDWQIISETVLSILLLVQRHFFWERNEK